jgi:hypothetical protein
MDMCTRVCACVHPCMLMIDREDVVSGRTLTHLDFKGDESFQCTSYRALPAVGEIRCIFQL